MNINCIICSDLFSQSDEIYSTPCGHVFHQACLLQWIERSSTCPQCRKKTTEKNIWKMYFNFLNTEGFTLDAGLLQVKLDNAEFQIKQRDKDIACLKDESKKLQAKCDKTDEVLLSVKEKLKTKEVALSGLKEQVDYLKSECREITQLRSNNEKLQRQIDLMKGLEEVIYGTASEVETMVNNSQDVSKLCTYIVVLKRAVMDSESKKKIARDNLQVVQNQMSRITMEKQDLESKVISLEESLIYSEDEIKQLKLRISELEKTQSSSYKMLIDSCHKSQNDENKAGESTKRKLEMEEKSEPCKKLQYKSLSHSFNRPSSSSLIKKPLEDSSSPYLNVKQCGNPLPVYLKKSLSATNSSSSKASEFSIFKTNRITEKIKSQQDVNILKRIINKKIGSDISYDGLGGHSKLDVFPIAKRNSTSAIAKKSSMKSIMKRVERPANQKSIDEALKSSI